MGNLVKILLVVVVLAAAAYFLWGSSSEVTSGKSGAPAVRPEEKVGVTTDTVGR